jgi:hypothetical protein
LPTEVGEAVVAHHDDRRLAAVAIHEVADHRIELLVKAADEVEPRFRLGRGTDRVLLVRVPPEDVRLEVAARKVKEEHG